MNVKRTIALFAIALRAPSAHAAPAAPDAAAGYRQRYAALAKDPAVVRLYAFDEGKGDTVRNLAGTGVGALNIGANDPYYNESLTEMTERGDYPMWTVGRITGKSALCIRDAKRSVSHSFFYGVPSHAFTVEAWVRTYAETASTGPSLIASIGNAYTNGWKLVTGPYDTEFGLGRPLAQGGVMASFKGQLSGHIWHHIVAVWDGDAHYAQVFVDGVPGDKVAFAGDYAQPTPRASNDYTPELDTGGLMLGTNGNAGMRNGSQFDIDELVIYNRALSATDAIADYRAGQPPMSPTDQIAQHKIVAGGQAALDKIAITVPSDSGGYFPVGGTIPVTFTIGLGAMAAGKAMAAVTLHDFTGAVLWRGTIPVNGVGSPAVVSTPVPSYGLRRIDAQLIGSNGTVIKAVSFPIGVRRPQLPIAKIPLTAPLAHFGATNMHPEDLAVGGKFERVLQPWCPYVSEGVYDWKYTDLYVNAATSHGLEVMYTLSSAMNAKGFTTFKDMADNLPAWDTWVRLVVNRYKDRVHYWEVLNEPNGGGQITAAEYVNMLKVANRAIREIDPTAKIIGICGTANFVEWTEDVLAAGGGQYIDILSFHNYIGTSPIDSRNKYAKVERVKAAIMKYVGHPLPMWNGECGIHQPVRVDGRAMTDDEMLKAYPGRSSVKSGWPTAGVDAIMMTTEHRSACWQVESILMDLASGAEKYFLLMGSNRYYPYSISTGQGFPSEKGIALAAMSSVTETMRDARYLPLSAGDAAGIMIADSKGTNTAVLFADREMTLPFNVAATRDIQGMDYLGNPLTFHPKQGRLALRIGQEPVYLFNVSEDLAETRLVSVTKFPAEVAPRATVQGEITLTNSSDQPLIGTLSLSAAGCKLGAIPAVTIAPEEKKVVPITLVAGDLDRGKHTLAVALMQGQAVASRTEFVFSSQGMATPVAQAGKPITLDGDTSDWVGVRAETADQPSQVVIGRPDVGVADPRWWQGPKDLSYTVKTVWRPDDAVYILIEVTDNTLTVAPEGKANLSYMWDCVELFFDGRALENQTTSYSAGSEQIVIVPRIGDTTAACPVVNFARGTPMLDTAFVGRKTATGYVVEGRIRPAPGGSLKLVPGTHFGMDVCIDDADGGQRRAQMALHGSEKDCFDTSAWGRYELVGK